MAGRDCLRLPQLFTQLILLVALAGALAVGCGPGASPQESAVAPDPLTVAAALGEGDTTGYLRAMEPRDFAFPADHGSHPGFRTEWWYFTGNLSAGPAPGAGAHGQEGRRFGFQLTFFRNQLAPTPRDGAKPGEERGSAWATDAVYMGHFALTDVAAKRFHSFERFAREAVGLAGAVSGGAAPGDGATGDGASGFRVWLADWEARGESSDGSIPPLRLRAAQDGIALDLTLEPGKPRVLQGERGLSRKGPEPGNASYYYSLPRMPAQGTVTVEGRSYTVSGQTWMDREWSTSVLSPEQVGWDWFSLQLADGRDLMVYRLRRDDGSADPASAGSLIAPDGSSLYLGARDFTLTPLSTWTSPASGTEYPARWRVEVPAANLDLEVTPLLPDQELNLTFRYWEGAVEVAKREEDGGARAGMGYVELTGY